MENKPALDKKYLYLNIVFWFGCLLANYFVKYMVRARQTELAHLFNVSPDVVVWASAIIRIVFLLAAGFYLSLRIRRYLNAVSAVCKEEIEKQERRKRELAEEDARARAWVHSSET